MNGNVLGKLVVLLSIILLIVISLLVTVGCQEQPEIAPPIPALAPVLPSPEGSPYTSEPEDKYVPDQIIVKFKPGTSEEAQERLNREMGAEVIYTSPAAGFKVLQIPEGKTVEEMVELYSKQSIVEYAEPNYIEHADTKS